MSIERRRNEYRDVAVHNIPVAMRNFCKLALCRMISMLCLLVVLNTHTVLQELQQRQNTTVLARFPCIGVSVLIQAVDLVINV